MTTMPEEFWTTKDGRRLAVGEMEEDHVRSVLRMILRNRRRLRAEIARKEAVQALLASLARRFDNGEDIDFIEWDER